MAQTVLTIHHEVGLHARPASLFVKTATKFDSQIQVRNHTKDSQWVDAKSILSVLTLEVEQGHEIELQAEGAEAEQAIRELEQLVEANFTPQPESD